MGTKQAEKLLPLIGAVVLLLSWAVQQTLFAEWNASLSRLSAAEAVFHSYRAANGVFHALRDASDEKVRDAIQGHQLVNYERGLGEVRKALDPGIYDRNFQLERDALQAGVQYDDLSADGKVLFIFSAMSRALAENRNILEVQKSSAERWFKWLYVIGSLLVIGGGVAKVLTGFTPSRSPPP